VYGISRLPHALSLGAVKSNIGHLEPSSGIAGLIKCLLVVIGAGAAPNIHLRALNAHFDLAGFNVLLLFEAVVRRMARFQVGVSSFGYGGTNAHALLASPREPPNAPRNTTRRIDER
jgi:acyl transferase domain-containing protein